MATKQYLLVVHGMGQHTEASVKKEVEDTFGLVFGRYDSLKTKKVSDLVEIEPVSYNDIIDKYRAQRAQSAESLVGWFGKINGTSLVGDAAAEVAGIEASLGKDEFFNTHWLDVLLYRFTFLKQLIRLRVATKLADTIMKAGGSANVHVLGHSLGTSVLHDTLAKCYGPENFIDDNGQAKNLSPSTHRLASIHMVANVSRALETFVEVGASIVRPSKLGCVGVFLEYRHMLDPIPMIKRFNPTNNGGWIPTDIWDFNYGLFRPSSVTQANVHALDHYLQIPDVHLPLFELLFGFAPKKAERDAGVQAYLQTTVLGKAQALQAAFGDAPSGTSVAAVLDAAKDLKDLLKRFGEQF